MRLTDGKAESSVDVKAYLKVTFSSFQHQHVCISVVQQEAAVKKGNIILHLERIFVNLQYPDNNPATLIADMLTHRQSYETGNLGPGYLK